MGRKRSDGPLIEMLTHILQRRVRVKRDTKEGLFSKLMIRRFNLVAFATFTEEKFSFNPFKDFLTRKLYLLLCQFRALSTIWERDENFGVHFRS